MDRVPFDWRFPHASRRMPVLARNVVSTSQPLAVSAGLRMLARGGNAVDAAVAAAITLVVVEPTNNGVGGDALAVVWDGEGLVGLNASGRSPALLDRSRFEGSSRMPVLGWDAVTVPGTVSAWAALSERFGRLPFAELFEPAVRYARDGFAVSPIVAEQWEMLAGAFAGFPDFAAAFLPDGRAPRPGEHFALRDLAATLEEIADTRGESVYRGALAGRIDAASRAAGAALRAEDLAEHRVQWVTPLAVDYRGWRVHELGPNTQGVAALIALGILDRLESADAGAGRTRRSRDDAAFAARALHVQIEAVKIGLDETARLVGDPDALGEDAASRLRLDRDALEMRAGRIDRERARRATAPSAAGDTVYVTAADRWGMMVSLIQSNYFAFGSGIVIPGTGISMHNRGACFSLERGHPNCVGPRRRPFTTLIPGFVTRAGEPVMSFGVMGGPMQAQGHTQLLTHVLGGGLNPQAAIDAPRWQAFDGCDVAVESAFDSELRDALTERGHEIREMPAALFGGAQAVWRLDGGYLAASDPRKDGMAAGF